MRCHEANNLYSRILVPKTNGTLTSTYWYCGVFSHTVIGSSTLLKQHDCQECTEAKISAAPGDQAKPFIHLPIYRLEGVLKSRVSILNHDKPPLLEFFAPKTLGIGN